MEIFLEIEDSQGVSTQGLRTVIMDSSELELLPALGCADIEEGEIAGEVREEVISEHTLAFLWGGEGKGRRGYLISFISFSDNRNNVCYQTISGPPRILIGETQ